MTGPGNGKPLRYRISYSGVIAKVIQELRYGAFLSGQAQKFDRAWRAIIERLRDDPWAFGEFVRSYPHLKLQAYVGSVYPITVQFGIHEELPMVIVAKIMLATPS
jgi:hypothetical protein